jgi:hypothetical protein
MQTADKQLKELEIENRRLKDENKRLEATAAGKRKPFSDDAIDGIAIVILIALIVTGVTFWLANMP